jgi:hypothetical protein
MAKKPVLVSLVKGIEIKLTPQIIGKILNVPYKGEFLDEIDMIDEDVLYNKILLPGKTLPMFSNKLRPVPRLVSRILSYNLLPKTGSFDHMSHELQVATYAIMANIKVNWASVMFEVLRRYPTTFLPFGAFLTTIFKHFKVDLESEKTVIEFNEIIDHTIVARMKLGNIQIPIIAGDVPPSSSVPTPPPNVSSSRTTPPYISHFDDSYYHTLSVQVANLTTGQGRLFSQQEEILKHQQDLSLRMDGISEDNKAILDLLRYQFPPPPPPSSS